MKQKPKEKNLDLIIRKVIDEKKYIITNYGTVEGLKIEVASSFPYEDGVLTVDRIRFFFSGKEMLNKEELWIYNVDNDAIIQMMVKAVD
jgi:hypothetical protein